MEGRRGEGGGEGGEEDTLLSNCVVYTELGKIIYH